MRKRERTFYRLESTTTVEYEHQGSNWGHPSTYAFVKFECVATDDLNSVYALHPLVTVYVTEASRFADLVTALRTVS
jgi:hypothetical protein